MPGFDADHAVLLALCHIGDEARVLPGHSWSLSRTCELATKYRVEELIAAASYGSVAPTAQAQALIDYCKSAKDRFQTRAQSMRNALLRVSELLHREGIGVIVLKGQALSFVLYEGDPGYKRMNDVDILVPRHDYKRALQILLGNGFTLEHRASFLHERMLVHHYAPILSPCRTYIDLHWNITGAHGFRIDLDRMWSDATPLAIDAPFMKRLSNLDFMNHLLIHLHYYRSKIVDTLDIVNAFSYFCSLDPDFPQQLTALARASKSEVAHYRSASFAACFTHSPALHRYSRLMTGNWFWRHETRARQSDPQFVLEGRTNYFGHLEQTMADILRTEWRQALSASRAAIDSVFFPTAEHLRALENRRDLSHLALARVFNLYRIVNYYRAVV